MLGALGRQAGGARSILNAFRRVGNVGDKVAAGASAGFKRFASTSESVQSMRSPRREPWMEAALTALSKASGRMMPPGIVTSEMPSESSVSLSSFISHYETVYERYFLPCSHGFRRGQSQLTCLKQVRRDFPGTVWFIEGQKLSQIFDTVDDQVLRSLLQGRVRPKNLNVLVKGLKAGLKASAQNGSITKDVPFAPLACNILLHQLDVFIMRLKRIVDRGRRRAMDPTIKENARKSVFPCTTSMRMGKVRSARTVSLGILPDTHTRRLNYVRFADAFLIGVIGPRALAVKIRDLVTRFVELRLKLRLDLDNTPITRAKDARIPFLGYLINRDVEKTYKFSQRQGGKWTTYRIQQPGGLSLLADMQKVVRRLAEKGFCDKSGFPKPNFKYYSYPQSKSVALVANIIRGIASYYHLANSKRKCVLRVSYILRSSLAKTYSAKFKLGSQAKVYARGGRDLSRPIKVKESKKAKRAKRGGAPLENRDLDPKNTLSTQDRRGGRVQAIPYTRYRHIGPPDTKPLSKDWQPRKRRLPPLPSSTFRSVPNFPA